MKACNINASVVGTNGSTDPNDYSDNRHIDWYRYNDHGQPLRLPLPRPEMVDCDVARLKALPANSNYPLPAFYGDIFGKPPAQWAPLSQTQLLALGRSRLGEYIINECM
jgi:hypothetical protein